MGNKNNMTISTRSRSKRRKKNKRSVLENILCILLILIIALIPFGFTVYFKILITPLLIFDVVWFAGALIGYIWLS